MADESIGLTFGQEMPCTRPHALVSPALVIFSSCLFLWARKMQDQENCSLYCVISTRGNYPSAWGSLPKCTQTCFQDLLALFLGLIS